MSKFSLNSRIKSFGYAFAGIKTLVQTQHNMWIHLSVASLVVLFGFLYEVTTTEWIFLTLSIVIVLFAEAMNTALEFLCDAVHPENHPQIKQAKDVAAAAVLITAIGAAIVGLIVFVPYIFG